MDRLHRATAYPNDRPDFSYVYDDGAIVALADWPGEAAAGRTPVLAFGSNAAPEQLSRKFGGVPGTVIPVVQAYLADFDVVYSAHLTAYGAVPATLASSPGTHLQTWINWLDDQQLARMHQSEMVRSWGAAVNYAYGELSGLSLTPDGGLDELERAGVYLSNHGALGLGDAPVALEAIAAMDRRFAAKPMREVLALVGEQLGAPPDIGDFVASAADDATARAAWTETLRRAAHPLDMPAFRPDDLTA